MQSKRYATAAMKLIRKLLKKHGWESVGAAI
ncbi:MAG: hypothetical protein O2967_20315 [Proteobacteria bacterium]|nr:hypothetical protein [Pseudomonadota bacterium]